MNSSVAAGVVPNACFYTLAALAGVSTNGGCAAVSNGPQQTVLVHRQGMFFPVRVAVTPDDVSQPDGWHGC